MSTYAIRESNNWLLIREMGRHFSFQSLKLAVFFSFTFTSFATAQSPNFQSSDLPSDQLIEAVPNSKPLSEPPTVSGDLARDDLALRRGELALRGSGIQSQKSSKFPKYKPLRYDEDYSFLRDPSKRTDCYWDRIKYIPLNAPDRYLSIGGEVRERLEAFHNPNYGSGPASSEGYNYYPTQRYMLHADLHMSPHLRFFTQTVTGLEYGAVGGPRPQTDFDQFGFHQAFVDIIQTDAGTTSDDKVTWRIGRQEMLYGSGRLIDVREGPNLRLSFDAVRVLVRKNDWNIDGFWSRPVQYNPYSFDDIPDPKKSLWGTYAVHPLDLLPDGHTDLYYLGYLNEQAAFNQGAGQELRHTLGTRLWGAPMPFEYNVESMFQFGSFANGTIRAWSIASAARYNFSDLPMKPRVGLRADVASGDRDANADTLQSFNPLFPAGVYFNLANPVGPINIIDLHPNLDLAMTSKLHFSADWNFFWRENTNDGIYSLSGRLVRPAGNSLSRYIGSTPALTTVWNPTRHVTLLTGYVHVFPGAFIDQSPPSLATDYLTTWFTYKF